MLDVMYDLPSIDDVKECIVNEETVKAKQRPILVYGQQKVGSAHQKVSG